MILDGKALSKIILEKIKAEVPKLKKKPHLAVILVGNDQASRIYVNNKKKTALEVGIDSTVIELPEETKEEELIEHIEKLNADDNITGILVQMPLPKHINKDNIVSVISPKKDVDCFTPENVGKLALGMKPYYYPVTPQGILLLLDYYNIKLEGKHVVVIGRSNIVGKPMAQMLLQRNATVTMCHTKTVDMPSVVKEADIVIVAAGRAGVIDGSYLREGQIVIDVGINVNEEGKLCGDVNYDQAEKIVEAITPVPGGAGSVTTSVLVGHVVEAAMRKYL